MLRRTSPEFDLAWRKRLNKNLLKHEQIANHIIKILLRLFLSMHNAFFSLGISSQVAPNWVKVATDGNIFEDKTFFEVSLKKFLLTSWPCSMYLKGPSGLVLYVSKKSWPYGTQIGLYGRKMEVHWDLENHEKIRLECSDKILILRRNLFFKML